MWPFKKKKKKENNRMSFDFTELDQSGLHTNIVNNFLGLGLSSFESQEESNTNFGGGDFGGAGAGSSWSDSSDFGSSDSGGGDSGGGD